MTVETFDTVHAPLLHCFGDLVRDLGGQADALLRKADVPPPPDGADPQTVSYRQLVRVLDHASTVLECPDFGLRLAQRQHQDGKLGLLGRIMTSSKTFGDALRFACANNHAHSLAARVWLRPLEREDAVFAGHDILLEGLPDKTQALEQVLLIGHLNAIRITGGRARARRVHFRHQPLSPRTTYRRYFGCEVRFEQAEDGLVYTNADLLAPVRNRDARTLARALAQAEAQLGTHHPPLHARVRGLLQERLGSEDSSNERVAQELGMNVRSLHRRLRAEDTTFQRVKDEVRRDRLLFFLQKTDLPLSNISAKLGFAEQSVMSRRCRQWFGASPSDLRRQGPHTPR